MNKNLNILLLLAAFFTPSVAAQPRNGTKQQKPQDQTAQVVLSNFAAMFMNIIAMAGNPHDPATLVQGGQGIVQGLANIIGTALKMVPKEEVSPSEVADLVYKKLMELNIHQDIARQVSVVATRHAFLSR